MNDAHTTVAELIKLIDDFVAEREWERFHDPKNLSMSMAIEAAELMEHFQWLRNDQLSEVTDCAESLGRIREELADVMCFLLAFANSLEIDVASAVEGGGHFVLKDVGQQHVVATLQRFFHAG